MGQGRHEIATNRFFQPNLQKYQQKATINVQTHTDIREILKFRELNTYRLYN